MVEQKLIREDELSLVYGETYRPGSFKEQLKEMFTPKYLAFLLKPGAEDEELNRRDFEMNKFKTKRSLIRRLNSPLTILGGLIVFIICSWAVFPHWLSFIPFKDVAISILPGTNRPPSFEHPLGTAAFGRDVLGRLIWGARRSITLSLASIVVSLVGGVIFGTIAAYKGGWIDNLIMRIADIVSSIPGLILLVIIVSVMGYDLQNILLALGLLGIPGYARLMRSAAISQRAMTYVESAKVSGASEWRIMFRHILPNSMSLILVALSFDIGTAILGLASLAFLGFSQTDAVEWGFDVNANKSALINAPWAAIWPGIGIVITVMGFMLLGDGLRDALDPRSKV
ncbi:MAG: ABC transporter permease [Candidatus Lokiarchaeota archaeon]|nr:ABC transporter permease [Candidatus Lokiarchaeota archaeon]